MSLRVMVLLAAVSTAVVPLRLHSQTDRPVIEMEPVCESCLSVEKIQRFGGPDLPFSFSPIAHVGRSRTGEFFVGSLMEIGPLARFSATGEFKGLIGRQGPGPGEFGLITGIQTGPGDSIIVLERERLTVLDASGQAGRVLRLPGHIAQAWPLSDGGFLVVGLVPRGHTFLPAVQILSADASLSHSFGPRIVDAFSPRTARDGMGNIWTVSPTSNGYRIEQWTLAGKLLQTATRDVDWDELARIPEPRGRRLPEGWMPRPGVQAFNIDSAGRLVVVLQVPSEQYWDFTPPRDGQNSDFDQRYDSMIEIIDSRTMRLIAAQRFDTYLLRFLPGELAISKTLHSSTGDVLVDVSRVSFRIRSGR